MPSRPACAASPARTVNVTWLDSEAPQHTADLTHSGYTATTVDFQMLQDNVGYIKIRQFDNIHPQ